MPRRPNGYWRAISREPPEPLSPQRASTSSARATDNIAEGDFVGAGREAAMAGGYGEHWNTAEQILDGDLEAAAVAGAGAAGETLGLPGLGGSLKNALRGRQLHRGARRHILGGCRRPSRGSHRGDAGRVRRGVHR